LYLHLSKILDLIRTRLSLRLQGRIQVICVGVSNTEGVLLALIKVAEVGTTSLPLWKEITCDILKNYHTEAT
jgi:hypothetical protein